MYIFASFKDEHQFSQVLGNCGRNVTFTPAHDEIPLDTSKTTSYDVMTLPLTSELSLKSSSIQVPKVNFLQDEVFNVYWMNGQNTKSPYVWRVIDKRIL